MTNDDDDIMSPIVGYYRWPMGSSSPGVEVMRGISPFYASRWHTLPNPMLPARLRRQFQVLVDYLGQLTWINVDPCDVVEGTPAIPALPPPHILARSR